MSTHSVRVVLIPLEASRSRALVLVLTLVAAAVLAAAIVGPAVAGYLADRATTLGALEHAVAWDPRDPDLHLRLGHSSASLVAAIRHKDFMLAEAAWMRRASLAPPLPQDLGRQYLNLLLEEGEGGTARRVWTALVPNVHPARDGDAVWDGGFEADRLSGWGLDWRVQRVWGVEVALDRFVAAKGNGSLRLTF